MFGAALYCQGGAFHSASNMFKHAVEIYKEDHPGDKVDNLGELSQNS
jgi:hypothetical protein